MRTRLATSLVALLSLLLLGTAPPSSGGGSGLPAYAAMVVDHARDQVFVSGGAGSDALTVMSYRGSVTARIGNMPGAAGMALVGSTLYVAREHGAAIDVVDARSLTKTGTISLPRSTTGALAYVRGRLWTQSGACGEWGDLMAVDPGTKRTAIYGGGSYCPLFRTSPMHPNYLFVAPLGLSPGTVSMIDVSYPTPRVVRSITTAEITSNVGDFAISPNGEHVYIAAGAPYYVAEYRVRDGAATGLSYPTGPYPNAVAVTDAAEGFVATGVGSMTDRNLQVYPQRSTTPRWVYDVGEEMADRGIAFATEAGRILAIDDPWDGTPTFQSYNGPSGQHASLSLVASAAVVASGESVRLRGDLGADGSPNRTVALFAQPFGQRTRRIATTTTASDGAFTFSVVPERNTMYFAYWHGDAEHVSSVSAARPVRVRLVTSLRTYGGYKVEGRYRYFEVGQRAPMVASTMPKQPGRTMRFRVQRYRDGRWHLYETADLRIPADGTCEAAFVTQAPGSYRIRAEYSSFDYRGDVSPWRYLRMTR